MVCVSPSITITVASRFGDRQNGSIQDMGREQHTKGVVPHPQHKLAPPQM